MHATPYSIDAASTRHTGLIVAAIVAATVLASAAALLAPAQRASWASSPGPQGATAAIVPVGVVGESAVAGDPSVPSAASVFRGSSALPEERVDTF